VRSGKERVRTGEGMDERVWEEERKTPDWVKETRRGEARNPAELIESTMPLYRYHLAPFLVSSSMLL
jgi:hypothetical protein